MLRVPIVVLLITTVTLAGCTSDSGDDHPSLNGDGSKPGTTGNLPPSGTGDAAIMTISGVVQDEDTTPISEATVSIPGLNRSQTVSADGSFVFQDVPVGFHVVRADATNYQISERTAKPTEAGGTVSLVFVLLQFAEEPYSATVHFEGLIQCSAEYIIITPSCDSATEYTVNELKEYGIPVPSSGSITDNETIFQHQLALNWQTVVLDMDFDEASQPGMDGLRITVRGINDADKVNEYEQYGRFHGAESYRIEPGQEYEDSTAGPVPATASAFEYQVYPRSHGYHPAGQGILGLGFGLDVQFNLYATAFYVEPAPSEWSFLA